MHCNACAASNEHLADCHVELRFIASDNIEQLVTACLIYSYCLED